MVDQQCRESDGKVKIDGYMRVSDEQAHHPLSTEIVTVLSHLATGECWGTEGKADGGKERRWQIKCGATRWCIKVVVAKRTKRMKRSMRANWRIK